MAFRKIIEIEGDLEIDSLIADNRRSLPKTQDNYICLGLSGSFILVFFAIY